MRRIALLAGIVLLVAACGDAAQPGTSAPSTSEATSTTSPATPPTTSTTVATTTGPLVGTGYSVEVYGMVPQTGFGPTAALGSGCSPGTEALPDGVWFGWVTEAAAETVTFDLACFWQGRVEPAISNDSARTRDISLAPGAQVFAGGSEAVPYEDWRHTDDPVWLFINDGLITQLAEYDRALSWSASVTAWPAGMFPGCCDGGTIAPVSPDDPWPEEGWPADGFYDLWVMSDGDGYIDVEIARWHDCDDRPDLCAEWWVGDEVGIDSDEQRLQRRITFEADLSVVVMPIAPFGEMAIVGDGVAYAEMLREARQSIEDLEEAGYVDVWSLPPELAALAEDPAFPFGPVMFGGEETGAYGFRGPGGALLAWSTDNLWWWHVLEIRDGLPILYIHAGIIAG